MKKNLTTGAACYFDYYRSCVVEYLIDRSNQTTESVTKDVGGVTTFSSRVVGDVILQVTKIEEITAYTIDEIAIFLRELGKNEYLIQQHSHLASFLPSCYEIELLEENSQVDHDLLLAMKKKSNFKIIDYTDKPTTNKGLILLALHVKPWFFTPVKKAEPSFCASSVPCCGSQEEEYPTAPRRVNELERYFASLNYSKTSTKVLEDGRTMTSWERPNHCTYTTLYDPTGTEAVALY